MPGCADRRRVMDILCQPSGSYFRSLAVRQRQVAGAQESTDWAFDGSVLVGGLKLAKGCIGGPLPAHLEISMCVLHG